MRAFRLLCCLLVIAYGRIFADGALPVCRGLPVGTPWRNCRVELGGLAIQGAAAYGKQFNATFKDFLTSKYNASYGLEFDSLALDFDQNFEYVGEKKIDFIYSNPAAYACMMVEFSIITVASMINLRKGYALERFAGVIFSRANSSFSTVESMRKARVEAVSISGLGAMQLQQAELLKLGLNVMTDVEQLIFSENQNKIVQDVQKGLADVGFVRTDMIERSIDANTTKWEYFQVINRLNDTTFPFARSTDYTPEWPIGALQHVPFEIMELVGRGLMELDSSSSDPVLKDPTIPGQFATWVTPMNYFGLLTMLESIGYYSAAEKKCLRASDVYSAVSCPDGYVKRAEADILCTEGCQAGYTCICKPCAKLKTPDLVLSAEALPTEWPGSVDVPALENLTVFSSPCQRMGRCISVASGQRLRWTLLDQIGAESRTKINAPLLATVQVRTRFDAEWATLAPVNITLGDGTRTQAYSLEAVAGDVGTHILQVRINDKQAELSPVVSEHFAPPRRVIVCGPGEESQDNGMCTACPPGTYGTKQGADQKPVCWPCQPGLHNPLWNQSSCVPCAPGAFSAGLGAIACEACEPGTSTIGKDGASECLLCEPGQSAEKPESPRCALCDRGTFADSEGSSLCEACPHGMTTGEVGATNASACGCPGGQYLATSGACRPCPVGATCNGFDAPPRLVQGFYMRPGAAISAETPSIFECLKEEHCPGGAPGTCADNRDPAKIACGACKSGSFEFGSSCMPCEGTSAAPVVLIVLFCCSLVVVFTYRLGNNPAKKGTRRLTFTAMGTLLIAALQTLRVFKELAIPWFSPFDTILRVAGTVVGDIEAVKELKIGCGMPVDASGKYFFRQMIPPVCIALCLIASCLKRLRDKESNIGVTFVNAAGTLLNVFFISVILAAVTPMVCYSHPGDSGSSVRVAPSVLCWTSEGEHTSMVIVGVIAFLVIPLPYAVCAIIMVTRLPAMVARMSPRDCNLLVSTRFFFERYKPSRYYFGLYMLLRGAVICLIPVVFATTKQQVILVSGTLWLYALVQQSLQPWRSSVTNTFDGLSCFSLTMFLLCGSLVDSALGTAIAIVFTIICIVCVGIAALRMLRVRPIYDVFLCHDPRDAAAQARLLQLQLREAKGWGVYVDMSAFEDYELLFDIVKSQTKMFVAYLTQDTLTRPACAGTLTMAHLSHTVEIRTVWTRTFIPPTEKQVEDIYNFVDITGTALGRNGITGADVQAALTANHLKRDSSNAIIVPPNAFEIPKEMPNVFRIPFVACRLIGEEEYTEQELNAKSFPEGSGNIILSCDRDTYEAVAACAIFVAKVGAQLGELGTVCNLCDYPPDDFAALGSACAKARAIAIFLSNGSLRSLQQLAVIAESIHAARATSDVSRVAAVVPIYLRGFAVPGDDYFTMVLPVLVPNMGSIASYVKMLFKLKTTYFSVGAADEVLDQEAQAVLAYISQCAGLAAKESLHAASEDFRDSIASRLQAGADEGNMMYRKSSMCLSANGSVPSLGRGASMSMSLHTAVGMREGAIEEDLV